MGQQPETEQVEHAPGNPRRKGPSLAIVIGGVFVLVLICGGVIAAVLDSAFGTVNRMVRSSYRLQSLTKAIVDYSTNNEGYLPPMETWDVALEADLGDAAMLAELLDSPRIEGTGNEMIYTPPRSARADGLALVSDVAIPSSWIVVREDESRLRPRDVILAGYLDGDVRMLTHDDLRAQLAQQGVADSQHK